MSRRKWIQKAPLESLARGRTTLGTELDNHKPSDESDSGISLDDKFIEKGKLLPMLYGKIQSLADEGHEKKATEDLLREDAEWWEKNTLDPKTGKTTDQNVVYDTRGENSGVCKYALLGKICPRGKDCHFKHPPQATKTKIGRSLCSDMLLMRSRYSFDVGREALVSIREVISPTWISVWILQESYQNKQQVIDFSKISEYPDEFVDLLKGMDQFYSSKTAESLEYQALNDLPDVFVAVRETLDEEDHWFRGMVVGHEQISGHTRLELKVTLLDLGQTVVIENVQTIRRLDQQFLKQPWFAVHVGLGALDFPISDSRTTVTDWIKSELENKLAVMKVVEWDEIDTDLPLVELDLVSKKGKLESFSAELIRKGLAVSRPVMLEENDEDYDSESEPVIVPG